MPSNARRRKRRKQDPSPAPVRAITSNRSLLILGGLLLLAGSATALGRQWLEAAALLAIGVVLVGASSPIFGRGRWQFYAGLALVILALAVFAGLVIRDLTT